MIKTAYVLFFSCMLLMSSCHSRRHDSSPKEENPEYESEYEIRENFINHIVNFDNAVQKNEIYKKILKKHGIDYEEEVKKEMEKTNKKSFKYPKKK